MPGRNVMTTDSQPPLRLPDASVLARLATGRDESYFLPDLEHQQLRIEDQVGGRRLLIVGGAGSIGAATTKWLCRYGPASVHVVDLSENNLAELVRDLRSRPEGLSVEDFRTLPIDFGSALMTRFLESQAPYDAVLNFAALKHVRSEKDPFSLLRMIETNVIKQLELLRVLDRSSPSCRYFCVSTDKAANPVSLMGATKRLMEHAIFGGGAGPGRDGPASSARFANVAFSDGSLLASFLNRLGKGQALAAPAETRRYFVSESEAAHICTLAAFCAEDHTIAFPRLDPYADLVELTDIAVRLLAEVGYEARIYDDEARATKAVPTDRSKGRYPLLVTSLDTSGEKPFEEFVGDGEAEVETGLGTLGGVRYLPAGEGALDDLVKLATGMIQGRTPSSKTVLVEQIASVIPQFQHRETGRSLDGRM